MTLKNLQVSQIKSRMNTLETFSSGVSGWAFWARHMGFLSSTRLNKKISREISAVKKVVKDTEGLKRKTILPLFLNNGLAASSNAP